VFVFVEVYPHGHISILFFTIVYTYFKNQTLPFIQFLETIMNNEA